MFQLRQESAVQRVNLILWRKSTSSISNTYMIQTPYRWDSTFKHSRNHLFSTPPANMSFPGIPLLQRKTQPNPRRTHIGAYRIIPDRNRRIDWDAYGPTILGWPSKGGVVKRINADLVELKQLGFNPLYPPTTRFADPEREDAFCRELRKIGGRWWPSEQRYDDVKFGDWEQVDPTEDETRSVWFGWPAGGGLLVLECDVAEGEPLDIARLRLASTMEQRCELLLYHFGAKFYEDPASYAGLADVYRGSDTATSEKALVEKSD